jgi:hypothetical protein
MATVTIVGDDKLSAAYNAHLADIGDAVNATAALAPAGGQIIVEAGKLAVTFGSDGALCLASEATAALSIQASLSVSVSASATVQGQAGSSGDM